jgi:hypothetical protein
VDIKERYCDNRMWLERFQNRAQAFGSSGVELRILLQHCYLLIPIVCWYTVYTLRIIHHGHTEADINIIMNHLLVLHHCLLLNILFCSVS